MLESLKKNHGSWKTSVIDFVFKKERIPEKEILKSSVILTKGECSWKRFRNPAKWQIFWKFSKFGRKVITSENLTTMGRFRIPEKVKKQKGSWESSCVRRVYWSPVNHGHGERGNDGQDKEDSERPPSFVQALSVLKTRAVNFLQCRRLSSLQMLMSKFTKHLQHLCFLLFCDHRSENEVLRENAYERKHLSSPEGSEEVRKVQMALSDMACLFALQRLGVAEKVYRRHGALRRMN